MVFVLPFAWMTELKSTLLTIVDDDMLREWSEPVGLVMGLENR